MPRFLTQFLDYYSSGFEKSSHRTAFNVFFVVTLFFSFCGLIFLAGGFLPAEWSWTSSLIIMLNGIAVFFSEIRARSLWRNLAMFLVLGPTTLFIEFIGVTTAFPFGRYSYSDVLSFRVAGVPLAIAFAWYSTVMTTRRIGERMYPNSSWLRLGLTAGVLVLAFDIALEPMASFICKYWVWENDIVPLTNYISWFVVGGLGVFGLCYFDGRWQAQKVEKPQIVRVSVLLYGVQLLLFVVTNIAHGFVQPAAMALLVVAAAFAPRASLNLAAKREGLLEK